MIERLKEWIAERLTGDEQLPEPPVRRAAAHRPPRPVAKPKPVERSEPDLVDIDPHVGGNVVDNGPGKNVLIRNKFVREDSGTHDTLKILDDSMIDSGEESGIDPYNTGQFDRSRNWDKRFRN